MSAAVETPWRPAVHVAESTHWYLPDGSPLYDVPNKSKPGETRPATLKDARPLGAGPGYSEVQNGVAKPQLVNYLRENDVLACLTSPLLTDYLAHKVPEADFLAHVKECSAAHSQAARDLGTAGHAAIKGSFSDEPIPPQWAKMVAGVRAVLLDLAPLEAWECERTFFSQRWGFGGAIDIRTKRDHPVRILCDFKGTDKPLELKKIQWPEHCRQLAAYDCGERDADEPASMLVNIYFHRISGDVLMAPPWLVTDKRREWARFRCHLRDWKLSRNYWPGGDE